MDDFLKQLRAQLGDVDVEKLLREIDRGKLDIEQLRHLDLGKGTKRIRKQIGQTDARSPEEEDSGEGFLSGVLLGVIVGAILALIFAPRRGSETRELVTETASGLVQKAEGLVSQQDDAAQVPNAPTLPDEPAIERDFGSAPKKTI